jgi:hypothetical protein
MRFRTIVGALSFGALIVGPSIAQASSHREAPFVTKNPKVDGTDFYAFESYEPMHTGMVTMLANYQPLQDAYAGPNYFSLDPDALYEISIDNDGDGVEDLTFQFQFQVVLGGTSNAGLTLDIGPTGATKPVAVPFYNVGLIPQGTGNSASLNVTETYTVGLVRGPRRGSAAVAINNPISGTAVFNKPADNVGAKSFDTTGASPLGTKNPMIPSTSGYATYAHNFIYSAVTIPGCSAGDAGKAQIFVGQRAEPFAVNLGPTFDLVDAPYSVVTDGADAASYALLANPIGAKNVTTIAIELPADCITLSAAQPVIGAWTTASVRQARVVNPSASFAQPSHEGGAWTQVSRLGNPLVNEVVIGLPDKDKFNSSEPVNDVSNFATYVEYPTLPKVIDAIYGTYFEPQVFPRTDLVAAFLTGIAPINAFVQVDGGKTPVPAEYIHLNTNTDKLAGIGPLPLGSQNRLGAAGCVVNGVLTPGAATCDPFGFPNGRRPGDDVVDEALDVVEGYLLPTGNADGYALLTDGVDQGACASVPAAATCKAPFLPGFPYLGTPTQGANGDGT